MTDKLLNGNRGTYTQGMKRKERKSLKKKVTNVSKQILISDFKPVDIILSCVLCVSFNIQSATGDIRILSSPLTVILVTNNPPRKLLKPLFSKILNYTERGNIFSVHMKIYWNILVFFATSTVYVLGDIEQDVVYEFSSLRFESVSGDFSSSENVISGIQVYNGTAYVNIPRLTSGVPVTLATVEKKNGYVVFKPFPSLKDQKLADCNALQSVGGIRVVRKTNLLYVADNKYLQCNAKLVIFDLVKRSTKLKYEFPSSVIAEKDSTQFEDIVVDGDGNVYIANAGGIGSIIVYKSKISKGFVFHDRMLEVINPVTFTFGNDSYTVNQSISEMTLSPDDDFLFFVTERKNTIQVPTKSFEDTSSRMR